MKYMKNSIISTGGEYSTSRMLVDYTNNLYMPLCKLTHKYYENLELEYDCCNLVNFGGKSNNDKYLNKRAELYFNLIDGLNKGVPLTEEIEDELNVTLFEFSNTGKLKLVDKDEIKEVLKHSPDQSDSLALTFNTGNLYENEEIEEQYTLKYRPWQ